MTNKEIELEEMYGDVENAMKSLSGEIMTNDAGTPIFEEVVDEKTGEKTNDNQN